MVVASISGIRGVVNDDLRLEELVRYAGSFASGVRSTEIIVGRDTRRTGDAIRRAVCGSLVSAGFDVADYGVISTPALFRESRLRSAPAIMITASHNEPEWNGMKLIDSGKGVSQEQMDRVLDPRASSLRGGGGVVPNGSLTSRTKSAYNEEIMALAGRDGGLGVSVAVDLNGGAAICHAPQILQGIGCGLKVIGGSPGVFSRTIDPTNDELKTLTETVKTEGVDVGFAFDCDGDRLVLVDGQGEKKSGDFMLALTLKNIAPTLQGRSVVVSVDTSRAVEDVVLQAGGTLYRSKVGEANVVAKMVEKDATLGGEGSSGGLIDASFNYCRDSMVAVVTLVKALRKRGSRVFGEVPKYRQARLKLPLERKKALAAIKKLQREEPKADMMDGIKLEPSRRSWVLIRVSGTEDAVRVSAESTSQNEADEMAASYAKRIKKLA